MISQVAFRWRFHSWVGAIGVLLLAFFWLFGPILTGASSVFFGDLGLYFIPQLDLQKSALSAGRIALWNPYIYCGTPFVGNPQAWPLYPTSALLSVLRPEVVAGVVGATHCFLGALGVLVFLNRRGRAPMSATLAALAWGFGGAVVSKMQFPNMVQAAAFFPWLLWGIDALVARPTARRGVILTMLVALSWLAAHPQMAVMQFYFCAAWTIFLLCGIPKPARKRRALLVAGFWGLGMLGASAQIVPVVQMARASVRPSLSLRSSNRFHLPLPAGPLNLVAPNHRGNPALPGGYSGPGNFWEPCCYLGLLTLALALYSLFSVRKSREIAFFAGASLVFLWLSFGMYAGLYAVAWLALPGIRSFHDPARFLIPATLCLCVLAASGLDLALSRVSGAILRRLLGVAALVLVSVDLLPFSKVLNPTVETGVFDDARRALAGLAPDRAGRILHCEGNPFFARYVSPKTYSMGATRAQVLEFLSSGIPNLPVLARVHDSQGYEPVALRSMGSLVIADREPDGSLRLRNDILARLAVTSLVFADPSGTRVLTRPFPTGEPRAQFWAADGRRIAVPFEEIDAEHVVVRLPEDHSGGDTVLRDAAAPGWVANVDGEAAPVGTADRVFRAVTVRADERVVVYSYDPSAWRIGLFLSLLALGACGALAARGGSFWPNEERS